MVVQPSLMRRFPTAMAMRQGARTRLPKFSFEYMDGGAGDDTGINRNWSALDAIEMFPRYGKVVSPPPTDIELFGQHYSVPIGISPIGGPGTVWPGAEVYMARAAQAARIPYTLGILSAITIKQAVELAPDVLWLQLYRFAKNDHSIGFDLLDRAQNAGVKALMLTIDTPVRSVRPREFRSGILHPFRMTNRLRFDALSSLPWFFALIRNGIPRFVNLRPYMNSNPTPAEAANFMRQEGGGAFTWEEIARYRDRWKGPLILKGVLHPEDAELAVGLGVDGLMVTNHGGRQNEALPSAIDTLPAVAKQVNHRATIILDSGVRSGTDVARSGALGADAAFASKAFLWSLGAIGKKGPAHLIKILQNELGATLGQLGCHTVSDLKSVLTRHPGAYQLEDFIIS